MAAQESADDTYATGAYLVEKELGVTLTPDYPAFKFVTQIEEIRKDYEKRNKEMERTKSGSRGKSFR